MSQSDNDSALFFKYAIDIFSKSGHTASSEPEFRNHSPELFCYFDNKTDVSLSHEQRALFPLFNNVSRLFTANGCVFFSMNLLTSNDFRSVAAHDIHTMIHPIVGAEITVCLFRCGEEVMLTFLGGGLNCILSDWYPMDDTYDQLLNRLDISNYSIGSRKDYFQDLLYMLARDYYYPDPPFANALVPIDFISSAGFDGIDKEALTQYLDDAANAPQRKYGTDYVEYDESTHVSKIEFSDDFDLLLLDIDDEDNPFADEMDSEEDEERDDPEDADDTDKYEFDDVDPEIFRDPTLMVKWLKREAQQQ